MLFWWLAWDTACGVVFGGGYRTDLFDLVASATGGMALGLMGFMAATSVVWRGRGCVERAWRRPRRGGGGLTIDRFAAAQDDLDQPLLPGFGVTEVSKH